MYYHRGFHWLWKTYDGQPTGGCFSCSVYKTTGLDGNVLSVCMSNTSDIILAAFSLNDKMLKIYVTDFEHLFFFIIFVL